MNCTCQLKKSITMKNINDLPAIPEEAIISKIYLVRG
jgi:hypothetical protein